jgi:hypothetical protein
VLTAVTLTLFVVLVVQFYFEREQRIHQINGAVCALVRAVPPGNDRIDAVRKQLRCGKYQPQDAIPLPPGLPRHR